MTNSGAAKFLTPVFSVTLICIVVVVVVVVVVIIIIIIILIINIIIDTHVFDANW